ncbi:TIGR04211 family SH3 domain-containing protein [Marinomonas mediterranea]|uniref:SH3 domain protein n=2 Tax=Marinomonas mediterranea TaxID=119864 RepID=F2JU46_MARM1|nr:SH3 domain protein [Marinomonas mediterranea MMB-1]WCN13596.1 TIGR04211 family SH3 domain-containing protein [Marinomonas mediterranea]WCN17662.1 TIGR04211 family SH3 domain-containing protein [Marinomonas mediterranea MMB-1]
MFKKCLTSLAFGVLMSTSVMAETVYVSDIQFIAIREGQSNNTRAVERGLKSGTPLVVLDKSSGYTKVRTPQGNEGWAADYFLSENRVSRDQLVRLETKLTEAAEAKLNAEEALDEEKAKTTDLVNQVQQLNSERSSLQNQLNEINELAQKARSIVEANEESAYKIESLQQQLNAIQGENQMLKSSKEQRWFIIGATTIIIGVLAGLVLPATRKKKTSTGSWS